MGDEEESGKNGSFDAKSVLVPTLRVGTRNEKTLPLQFVLEEEGDLDRFAFGALGGLFSPRFRMSKELVVVRFETMRQAGAFSVSSC